MSRRAKKAAQIPGQKEVTMSEETFEDERFDPSEHTADEVKAELEQASEEEKAQIAAAEMAGKNRKSVLAASGVEEGERLDSTGRRLLPWEVAPKPQER